MDMAPTFIQNQMIYCVDMGVSSTMTSDYDHDRFYVMWRFLGFVYAVIGTSHCIMVLCIYLKYRI